MGGDETSLGETKMTLPATDDLELDSVHLLSRSSREGFARRALKNLEADQALRRATWYGHLGHDQQPIVDLVSQLRPCCEEEMTRLSERGDEADRNFRRERFADHLMILYPPDRRIDRFNPSWPSAESVAQGGAPWNP
jgi:hypothetical protein